MKRLFALAAFIPLAGCKVVGPALDAAKGTLAAPPTAVADAIKTVFDFLLQVLVGFASNVFGPLLAFLGL